MKEFCIPVSLAQKLKDAANKREFDIETLYNSSSAERRAIFEKYTDSETARLINTGFEEAIVSSQKTSLKNWAKKTLTTSETKSNYKDVITKIDQLDEIGALDPENSDAYLEDLVASKLGLSVTPDQAMKLKEFSDKLEALKPASDSSEFGISIEFLKMRRQINDYIESLTPASNLKVATSTIGRGTMLLSFKSPFLNITSNTLGGFLEATNKRITSNQYFGKNGDVVRDYMKFAMKAYKETGFDITRMMEVQLSPKSLGEDIVTSQGPGQVRRLGRFMEDFVFNKTLGLPDVAFSAFAFGDTANLESTMIARAEGLTGAAQKSRARAIMIDSMRLEPLTEEGRAMRNQSIADAAYSTYQNNTMLSKLSMNIRRVINEATGDLRLGDQLMPFVKTPANVISFGFDYSVGGVAKGSLDMKRAIDAYRKGDSVEFKKNFKKSRRNLVRAGMGLSIALILVANFDDDDFMGAYPTTAKERELMKSQNALPNSIRIGDRWISLDYFGALAFPLMGFMYAKKYGNDLAGQATNFLYGQINQLSALPGYEEARNIIEGIADRATKSEKYNLQDEVSAAINDMIDFVSARVIPGGVSDLAKMVDDTQREVDYKDPIAKLKVKIPFLSKDLNEKTDILGNTLKQENPLSVLLFGARVKSDSDNAIINELERLKSENQLPSITDPRKYSDRFIDLGTQLSEDEYKEAYTYYQTTLASQFEKAMNSNQYMKLSDEDKANMLNAVKSDVLDKTLKAFNYKKSK